MSAKRRRWDDTKGWPVPQGYFVRGRLYTVSPRPLQVHKADRRTRVILRPELKGEKVNSRLVRTCALHQGGSSSRV